MVKRFPGIQLVVIMTFVFLSALSGLTATSASAATIEQLTNNNAIGYCLNGYIGSAHAEVTMTSCNTTDTHMQWQQNPDPTHSWFTLENESNLYCLNGYIGSAHAEVTMTPCNTTDTHMQWQIYAEVSSGGSNWFVLQNRSNLYCLNGYIGSAHAEVTMTPCDTTDKHMQWQQWGG